MRSYHKDEVRTAALQLQIFLETEVKLRRTTVQTLTESADAFLHTQIKWIDTWGFDINYSLQLKDN